MQVLNSTDFIPAFAKGAAIAIGNFDGVHRGHQALIAEAVGKARALGRPSGVIVFEPHPRQYFAPEEPHFPLTPLKEKLRVLETLGLKLVVVLPFDARMASLTAEAFIDEILVANLAVGHVVIGYDFFFGRKRGGNPQTMRDGGSRFGFGVTVVEPVAHAGEVFSSSEIRLKLARGDVAGAAHALGRNWRVSGTVIGGAKRGTGMGFPTANVPMPHGTALGHGIYAVHAIVDGQRHDAAAYLGTRPTFDDGMPVLEVFLLDFDGDLYGREMTVEFIGYIRPDRKFADAHELVAQMEKDVAAVRLILGSA